MVIRRLQRRLAKLHLELANYKVQLDAKKLVMCSQVNRNPTKFFVVCFCLLFFVQKAHFNILISTKYRGKDLSDEGLGVLENKGS